jgi:hypothetical protein
MRLIARRVAAVVAIVLGLACVGLAAFGTDGGITARPAAPNDTPAVGSIPPLDPRAGNTDIRRKTAAGGSIFNTEFGKRGKHEVTISVNGRAYYAAWWRDGTFGGGRGPLRGTKVVTGGFPLVRLGIDAKGGASTCTITVDGRIKDQQSTSSDTPIVFCEA